MQVPPPRRPRRVRAADVRAGSGFPIRPLPGVWLVSGTLAGYPKSSAAQIAQAALDLATRQPGLVLAPGEAEQRLNAYYRHRQEAALAAPNSPGSTATPTPPRSSRPTIT
jgi:hypothetical protein